MKGRGLVFLLLGVGLLAASCPAGGWVSGTGEVDISRSVENRMDGFESFNSMTGDGSLQIGASKEGHNLDNNGTSSKAFSLSYSGDAPLVGIKRIEIGSPFSGTRTSILEAFSATEMEKEEMTVLGAGGSELVGTDTRISFNGTYMTASNMHQVFARDVSSHQRYTGTFEIDSSIQFGDLADRRPAIELSVVPGFCSVEVGAEVTRNYTIANVGTLPVQGITLVDSRVGPVPFSRADLNPGETATATSSFIVAREDLPGPLNDSIQATAADFQGNLAQDSKAATVRLIPQLDLTVTASRSCADIGEVVVYTYNVENLGDLPITVLNLTDSVGGGPVFINLTLMPDERINLSANQTVEMPLSDHLNNSVSVSGITSEGERVRCFAEFVLQPC